MTARIIPFSKMPPTHYYSKTLEAMFNCMYGVQAVYFEFIHDLIEITFSNNKSS